MITLEQAKDILRVDGADNDSVIQAICDALPSLVETQTGMSVARQKNNKVVMQLYGFMLRSLYYADQADDLKLQRTIDALLKAITLMSRFEGAVLLDKTFTANGKYVAFDDDDADGYAIVNVEVPPNVMPMTITENGTYDATKNGVDGYSVVEVAVPPNVIAKTFTEEGTYNAVSDGVDGYSIVEVNTPWNDRYMAWFEGTEVYIPEGVTKLRANLFAYVPARGELVVPSSVERLETGCFYYSDFDSVVLPDGLQVIVDKAFYGCEYLKKVNLPDSLTSVSYATFAYCGNLSGDVVWPSLLGTMDSMMFYNCSKIDNFVIMNENKVVTLYATDAFYGTKFYQGTANLYVPDALVGSYKTATNWVRFADNIKPLSEYTGGA